MKTWIKHLLIFTTGVAAGAVPVAVIANKKASKAQEEWNNQLKIEVEAAKKSVSTPYLIAKKNVEDKENYIFKYASVDANKNIDTIIDNIDDRPEEPNVVVGWKHEQDEPDPEERVSSKKPIDMKEKKYSASYNDKPYFINPSEAGSIEDYDFQVFTMYKDGIVTDTMEEIIGHPSDLIGDEVFEDAGEQDIVYIRNDKLMTDYEIIMSDECYYIEDVDY